MRSKEEMELLPYLFKTVYEDSWAVKGGYTYELLEESARAIPKNKRNASINFCLRNKIHLEQISNIFQVTDKLNKLGSGYADKKYDRYRDKILNFKIRLSSQVEDFQKSCTNPEALENILESIEKNNELIPLKKPSAMINNLIHENEIDDKEKNELYKIFGIKQSLSNKTLKFIRVMRSESYKALKINR